MNKLFDQVGGIISVRVKGRNLEKIINMALARGIYIWDVKKIGDSIDFKVRSSGCEALVNIANENGCNLEIREQKGLPFFKGLIKRRIGFIGGALVFVLTLYILSAFIWFVDVTGNRNVSESRILLTAAKRGIYRGAAKWNFSRSEVEKAMLCDIAELSYVKVDIQGVRANIRVVEKVLPKKEITGPCNMVAAKDGVVEEILVLEGQARVEKGDVVTKGDILISGIVFPEKSPYIVDETEQKEEPYLVRARGEVKARVWYEGYGECSLKTEKKMLSGRSMSKVYVKLFGRDILIKGRGIADYSQSQKKKTLRVIKSPLGEFGISKIVIQELVTEVVEHTEDEAAAIAEEKAMEVLAGKIGNSEQISSRAEIVSLPSDSILRVKVRVEAVENIAVPQPINRDENGN
ncbi:MAG: sporulation protein YqfD [Syntrophomonadaceae bacterium]|nr:sporulation protein YqfD [Syntrophomonadaceae bacterium]